MPYYSLGTRPCLHTQPKCFSNLRQGNPWPLCHIDEPKSPWNISLGFTAWSGYWPVALGYMVQGLLDPKARFYSKKFAFDRA